VSAFDGDLEDYRSWLVERRRTAEADGTARPSQAAERKHQRRVQAEERNRLSARRRPLEQKLKAVEAQIARLTGEKTRLETLIADPNFYDNADREKVKGCLMEQARTGAQLQQAEHEWLELQQALEDLEVGRA
jgi:ATP-binding cassette subfamily F protein 3